MNARTKPKTDRKNTKKPIESKAGAPVAVARDEPLVTIVISFRERWRFTPMTVKSILKHSKGKFALWLLDSGIPDAIRKELEPHIKAGELELVAVEGEHPNHWRASIIPRLMSRYAVFIDNDVVVMPDWLDHLVTCAEETGAGIICPLYLWGDREESDEIHMAGGDLTLEPTGFGVRMTESHRHVGRKIAEVPQDLHRRTCGFGEFHCLMMRREIYSAEGAFDPGIVTVHEHIHASMLARDMGYETWFEPKARVNYLAFVPWQVGELNALRDRWDYTAAENSLAGFARRWKVIDDDEYRALIRRFLVIHAGHTDLIDPRPQLAARRDQIMTRGDLQQTFAGLEWLAHNSGYEIKDIRILLSGYRLGMTLCESLYRPCGRPFINHLAGTASVLIFYGCAVPHIVAALLHAAHTHGPKAYAAHWLERFANTGTETRTAVNLVNIYGGRAKLLDPIDFGKTGIDDLPLDLASLFLLDAANEVDMHLSLEVAVSGRTDVLSDSRLSNSQALVEHIGLPGLAATLRAVRDEKVPMAGVAFRKDLKLSFRLEVGQSAESQQPGAANSPPPRAAQGQPNRALAHQP